MWLNDEGTKCAYILPYTVLYTVCSIYVILRVMLKLGVVSLPITCLLFQALDGVFANSFLLSLLVCITGTQVYQ